MKLEALIAKHKPAAGTELEPCSGGVLFQLNFYRLLGPALELQAMRDEPKFRPDVISKITAWEILSAAQRNGLRVQPQHKLREMAAEATRRRH